MIRTFTVHLRRHAVAYLALFIALGGTTYAASLPRNSVGTAQLKDRSVTAPKLGRTPAVSAFTPTHDQTLTDGQSAAVSLKQEHFDTAQMHSADNDTRIVAPVNGTYVVQATAEFSGGTCGGPPRVVLIQRHARSGVSTVDHVNSDTRCNELTRVHAGAVVRLRAGDYLEMLALQRSSPQVGVGGSMSVAYLGG
jgi:hypothetical protein